MVWVCFPVPLLISLIVIALVELGLFGFVALGMGRKSIDPSKLFGKGPIDLVKLLITWMIGALGLFLLSSAHLIGNARIRAVGFVWVWAWSSQPETRNWKLETGNSISDSLSPSLCTLPMRKTSFRLS